MEWAWASGLGRRNVAEGGWRGGREESGTGPKSVLPPVEASQRVVSTVLVCYTARRLGYPAEERKEEKKNKPKLYRKETLLPLFCRPELLLPGPWALSEAKLRHRGILGPTLLDPVVRCTQSSVGPSGGSRFFSPSLRAQPGFPLFQIFAGQPSYPHPPTSRSSSLELRCVLLRQTGPRRGGKCTLSRTLLTRSLLQTRYFALSSFFFFSFSLSKRKFWICFRWKKKKTDWSDLEQFRFFSTKKVFFPRPSEDLTDFLRTRIYCALRTPCRIYFVRPCIFVRFTQTFSTAAVCI